MRRVLMSERADVVARIAGLARDFQSVVDSSSLAVADDEHDPEGATIAFERAQVVALLEQARDHLAELDHADERLGNGSYGTCERCRRRIAVGRLAARPATRTCIDCARVSPR